MPENLGRKKAHIISIQGPLGVFVCVCVCVSLHVSLHVSFHVFLQMSLTLCVLV